MGKTHQTLCHGNGTKHNIFQKPLRKLGELGLMGILIPEEYGGAGLSYNEYVTALIEIGKVDSALCLSVAAHNSHYVMNHIYKPANENNAKDGSLSWQREEWIGAWGLSQNLIPVLMQEE